MPPGREHAMPRVLQSAAVTCRHGLWCCAVLSRHVEMLQDRDKRGDQARWRSGTRGAESSLSTSTLNRHEPRHLGAISMVGAKPNRPTKGKFRPRENSDRQRPRAHTTEECQNARMPECQSASDAKTEGVNRPSSTSTTSMNPWCGKIAEQKRGARSSQLRPPITPNEWAHQYCTETPAVPSCTLRTLAAPSATLFGYNHNSPSSATLAFAPAMHLGISTPAALTSAKAGEASRDPMTSRCMTARHDRTPWARVYCTVSYRTQSPVVPRRWLPRFGMPLTPRQMVLDATSAKDRTSPLGPVFFSGDF